MHYHSLASKLVTKICIIYINFENNFHNIDLQSEHKETIVPNILILTMLKVWPKRGLKRTVLNTIDVLKSNFFKSYHYVALRTLGYFKK
jgi:hypothetical protein